MVTFLSKEEMDHRVVAAEVAEVASLSISLEPLKPIANQSKATIGMELLITQEEMLEKLMKSLYKPPQEPTAQYSQLSASQASGPFCQACPIGTYKYGYSFGTCLPCINKPENSEYDKDAQTKAICSYECKFWESSDINKECLNPLSEEFE